MDLDYDPDTKIGTLSIAKKQMIEILKALSRNCKVIIMDEPTSALTNIEAELLFTKIKELKEKDIAFVFISHRLEELFKLCDEYTVLRDGKYIGSGKIKDVDKDKLISMMVGREVKDIYPRILPTKDKVVFKAENLNCDKVFHNISFEIKEGEILGFAGMMGAGRSEIAGSIFGMHPKDSGKVYINDKECRIKSTGDAIKAGIAMVTEDRASYGFVGVRSIKDNIILPNSDIFSKKGWLNKNKIQSLAGDIFKKLSIKAPGLETLAGTLSGGNQQKVVLSKWLVRNVKLLIMDEPTRGIDVGAKQEIYKLISNLASQGMAILLISSDMPEVLSMSHRVIVIANGKKAGELSREEITQDKVMKMIVEVDSHNEN
jgi:ABC-type sugar transport system ATPase subunit